MAEPLLRSIDQPPADVDGTTVYVRDQNWEQGESNNALNEPLFVKRWSLDNGQTWSVPAPPKRQDFSKDPPDANPPGAVLSGMTMFDFRGLVPEGESAVLFEVFASTHSVYPGQYDYREWAQTPARFPVTVTKAAAAPPPPPPLGETLEANEAEAIGVLYRLVEQWRRNGVPDTKIAATLHYRILKALGTTAETTPTRAQVRDVLGGLGL